MCGYILYAIAKSAIGMPCTLRSSKVASRYSLADNLTLSRSQRIHPEITLASGLTSAAEDFISAAAAAPVGVPVEQRFAIPRPGFRLSALEALRQPGTIA